MVIHPKTKFCWHQLSKSKIVTKNSQALVDETSQIKEKQLSSNRPKIILCLFVPICNA